MSNSEIPVPHLTTAHAGPLHFVEEVILNHLGMIEAWFRKRWQETPPPITSSVDLRQAGFKIAPVDTNLFPAGFNNLNPEFLPLCIQAAQSVLVEHFPSCTKILLLPENHTRNPFYLQSLAVLRDIFLKAGYFVRIGSLDEAINTVTTLPLDHGEPLIIEPIIRTGNTIGLENFSPCLLLLNNDLSTGIPTVLQGLEQHTHPTLKLGWSTRLKSSHFEFYNEVALEFSKLLDMDPWFINPLFTAVKNVDFLAQSGIEEVANAADQVLMNIREKYQRYGIKEQPFVAVKTDNGTFGMGGMMVRDGAELLTLNRKQRTRMSATKGSQKVNRVMIQEGVLSYETMPNGAVAEPVVYMIGGFVVGGFYRVHQTRGKDENLNAVGMHFEPLAFAEACNVPCNNRSVVDSSNRFYVYGVIARLAALAAAREIAAVGESS